MTLRLTPLRVKREHVYYGHMNLTLERPSPTSAKTRYPQRVARAKWTPPNDEVAGRVDRVVQLAQQLKDIEAEYRRALAEVADPDGDAVPVAYLAKRLDIERKTVYRHLGRSMT